MTTKSNRHWAHIEERGVYLGLSTMLAIYRLLGRRIFMIFLYPVIGYFFVFGRTARQASLAFLQRVHQRSNASHPLKKHPNYWDTFRHIRTFGEIILDKFSAWVGEIDEKNVDVEDLDVLLTLIEQKRGGLILASHLGNAEVSRAIGSMALNVRINVLVHTKHSENFNRLMRIYSPQSTTSLFQVTDVDPATAIMLSQRIENGEFVVIVGDRTPVRSASLDAVERISWAEFLGEPAPFPQGPYILASLLKCPVITMFCLKKGERYRIVFEAFADQVNLRRKMRDQDVKNYVEKYAAILESYCLEYPFQWFNFFDFWGQANHDSSPLNSNEIKLETRSDA